MHIIFAYAVFFLLISSGGVFCAARFGRKYEEILPVTCMGIVLILFLFGVLGILRIGVYAVLLLSAALYLLSAATLAKSKDRRAFLTSVVTPGAVVFVCAFIALAVLNRGRLAYVMDEFSHWVDIVKVMTALDDFGTNPASHSAFQSYPPGMSLFQYFLQRIVLFFKPDAVFHEASVYVAYQVFFFSILFPFFKGQSFRRPLRILLTCAGVFFAPHLFYHVYRDVLIDPFLGVLAGAGFAAVFLNTDRDWVYSLYIWLLCSTLVLAKDSGLLFASLLAAAYCVSIFDQPKPVGNSTSEWKKYLSAGASLLFVLLPKLLWNLELKTSGAVILFSEKVDFAVLLRVLTGRDTTYRAAVFRNWTKALISPLVTKYQSVKVSWCAVFAVICLLAFLLYKLFAVKEPRFKRTRGWVMVIMPAEIVIFVFGLCVMYLFKFSEYEALRLASFTRYTCTALLAACIALGFIALSAIDFAPSPGKRRMLELALLALAFGFLATPPAEGIRLFVRRDTMRESVATRAPYEEISEKITDVCDGRSNVYFISQEDPGLDHWIVRFNVRPNIINNESHWHWSIGEGPFFEGDVWTTQMTAEQWHADLIQNYDYVALYRLNDYFYEHYAALFEDPSQIGENAVYRVDKDTGLLVFCK